MNKMNFCAIAAGSAMLLATVASAENAKPIKRLDGANPVVATQGIDDDAATAIAIGGGILLLGAAFSGGGGGGSTSNTATVNPIGQ